MHHPTMVVTIRRAMIKKKRAVTKLRYSGIRKVSSAVGAMPVVMVK